MTRIKSFSDLQILRENYISTRSEEKMHNDVVQINVGMATCGIASGAREIMKYLVEQCEQQAIDVKIKQTGCLGYCYAEPMIEVQLPGGEPKVFGYVDKNRAGEIIEKYIIKGESVEGEISISFKTLND